jgi:hypothetical protein
MGRPLPGHARAVEGDVELQVELVSAVILWLSNEPERCCMKRLTEWINLIAAVIRLFNVISRTGWF